MNPPSNTFAERPGPLPMVRFRGRPASFVGTANDVEDSSSSLLAVCIAVVGGALIAVMLNVGLTQLTATIFIMVLLVFLALIKPQVAILSACVFLAVMGDLRRLLIQDVSASLDPVLLIGPAVAVLLTSIAYFTGRLNLTSRTSKLVRALLIVMFLQIFNPLQGGLAVGIAGTMFYLIPVLWFWIGQAWGSEALLGRLLCWIVVPVGAAASIMGIHQAFYGFYPFELDALHRLGFYQTKISGTELRPWGFFTSTSEYTAYLAIGIVIPIALLFAGRFRMALLIVPLLAFAAFVSGVRGPVVAVLMTMVLLWATLSQSIGAWSIRLVIAAAVFLSGLVWMLNEVQEMDLSPQVSSLVQHQTDGLLNIQDQKKSTGTGHLEMVVEGIFHGIANPLGTGLGSTTLAAGKFGASGGSTEMDISDAFESLGIVGGFIYIALVVSVLAGTTREWRRTRSPVTFAVLAILFVMFGRWMNGGQYATAALCWFCIGGMDRVIQRSAIGPFKGSSDHIALAHHPNGRRTGNNVGVFRCA
jgi:hypothetical protein